MQNPIVFISTPIKISFELPKEVGKYFIMRRASKDEIEIIKHHIAPFFSGGTMNQNPFEQYYKKKNPSVGTLTNLAEEDFRYFVFDIRNISGLNLFNENPVDVLRIASELTKAELKLDLQIYQPKIVRIQHNSLHKTGNQLKYSMFEHYSFNENDFQDLKDIYDQLELLFEKNDFLRNALIYFKLIQENPLYFNIINLNYFSLLEMLVTTRNENDKPSISEQLKGKTQEILELRNYNLDFSEAFDHSTDNNIWNKLYEYRSCLAHGSSFDFNGKLKKLGSEENVYLFLKSLIKKLFRCYLFNFDLVYEIKKRKGEKSD